jgi:hypothetical protein
LQKTHHTDSWYRIRRMRCSDTNKK